MEQWYPLILFLLIQCATPGPHNLTCLYLGGRHGLRGTWGFIVASLGMVFLKALLCGALNMILARFLPEAVKWIKWLGCAYILYLAVNMALSGWREEGTAAAGAAEPGWKSGVILQLFSGKSWIMCLSLFATYGAQIGTDVRTLLLICLLMLTISLVMSLIWTLSGLVMKRWIGAHRKAFGVVMGLALGYCAVMAVL
jgi:cysteine/O-acetylserine efflux protein